MNRFSWTAASRSAALPTAPAAFAGPYGDHPARPCSAAVRACAPIADAQPLYRVDVDVQPAAY